MKHKLTLLLATLLCLAGVKAWALDQNGGVYQIGTAAELAEFAALVNGGEANANAVLTADIDYTANPVQIGNPVYNGVFDGQGHKVTVAFEGTNTKGENAALFFKVGGTVKNLCVSGTISSPLDNVAAVVFNLYGWVDHCYSDATIISTKSGSCSSGGIVGQSYNGSATTNCFFAGKFSSETATNFAGIIGWSEGNGVAANCLVVAQAEGSACGNSSTAIARNSSRTDNCYYLYNDEANFKENSFQSDKQLVGSHATTADELKSGKIAYLLGWGQEIGVDDTPNPFSPKKVYPMGSCTEPTGYTNDAAQSAHTFSGMKCSACGTYNPDYMTPVGGVYQIGTADQLQWFALKVNDKNLDINGALTADIDMAGVTDWPMIGSTGVESYYNMYRGTFDGQYHKISNLSVSKPEAEGVGLFGMIGPGSVIKNLFTDATCSFYGLKKIGGIMGYAYGAGVAAPIKLLNLGSAANVAAVPVTSGGQDDAGVGGITGNCAGGIKGEITNCWFEGDVSGTSAAFISGWCGTNQFTLTSCWSISESAAASLMTRAGNSGTSVTLKNCFAVKGTQVPLVTTEEVANGALTWGINGESAENPTWFQKIGTDPTPTLQGTDIVYKVGTKNCDGSDGEGFGFSNENTGFTQLPHQVDPTTGVCSICGQLSKGDDGWYEVGTTTAFLAFAEMAKTQADMKVRLTADLDFAGVDDSWAPIGGTKNFVGQFDGQGHKFSNLVLNQPTKNDFGVFKTGANVVLKNFYLDASCSITGAQRVGLIGNHNGAGAVFENIGNAAKVAGDGGNVAGLIGGGWAGSGTVTFNSCWIVGEITTTGENGASAGESGAFCGWTNTGTFIFNDCWTTANVKNASISTYFTRFNGNNTMQFNNCYSLFGTQVKKLPGYEDAAEADATARSTIWETVNAELARGAIAYVLNGDQSTIKWYQTLGEDATPVPWDSHKRVYGIGALNCDGKPLTGTLEFTNDGTLVPEIPPHQYDHGFCQNCGSFDANYKPLVDGFYELDDALDLYWFSTLVNNGNKTANARLTADIDMTDVNDRFQPIGAAPANYGGTFDGDFHVISNLKINRPDINDTGFIGVALSGMTLKNIIFDSTCEIYGGKYVGVVGASLSGQTSNINLTNIGYEGKIYATTGENAGGIIGCNHGSAALYVISNCYVSGHVEGLNQSGAISGWMGSKGGSVTSCWVTAEVVGADSDERYLYRNGSTAPKASRLYATVGAQGTIVSLDDVVSGELTWKLNGESFLDATWFQTIGEDVQPTFVPNHGLVYKIGETLGSVYNEGTYEEFRQLVIEAETKFVEETVASQNLLDLYGQTVESWGSIETLEEFLIEYRAGLELKNQVQTSAKAYQKYADACAFASNYLAENSFESDMRTLLENYLNTDAAPSEEYPNGTSKHIMAVHELNDEQIAAETDFVNNLLQKAIATNIIPGTEITVTLNNYDFSDGLNGWDVEDSNKGATTGGETSIMHIARGLNTQFSIGQTLTEVPNGIYVMSVNGFSRAGNDIYSEFYAGQLFLNDNMNYLMAPGEDAISKDDAEDGVNCHITGTSLDDEYIVDAFEGWTPGYMIGCSYAYNAGRYLNYAAVEVTDSTLTLGVRNPGTGLTNDWTPFGNIHVYYLGSAEQASQQLDAVLDGYVARAQTIVEFIGLDTEDGYGAYPYMSEELKGEVDDLITERAQATTGEQKMALINKFSEAFQKVYSCRKAYIALYEKALQVQDQAIALSQYNLISETEFEEVAMAFMTAIEVYTSGDLDEAGVQAEIEKLNAFNFAPEKDENGVYQLSTGRDLGLFALLVNTGEYDADAVLTADVDLTDIIYVPIGWNLSTNNSSANQSGALYRGHFDGQGHRVSNLKANYPESIGVGMFGDITNPAHIENFVLDASCEIHGKDRAGVVGRADATDRSGADRIVTINNVGNEGKVYADTAPAGILGNANWGAVAIIHDCYSSGLITVETEANRGTSDRNASLICGWLANQGAEVTNCWSTAEITNYQSVERAFCRVGGDNNTFCNNYSTFASQATVVDASAFESGEVTYKLNGGQTDASVVWTQTIGEDQHPVFRTSQIVFFIDGQYVNNGETAIRQVTAKLGQTVTVYDAQGRMVRANVPASQAVGGMKPGMYILKGESKSVKVLVK